MPPFCQNTVPCLPILTENSPEPVKALLTSELSWIEPTPEIWLKQILSLKEEKSFAKDLLMHSRLINDRSTPTLLYLGSLSCFMTPSIEAKIRKIVLSLGYPFESLPIRTEMITLFPQQLCDAQTSQEKNDIQKNFEKSTLGRYLQANREIWVVVDEN